VVAVNLDIQTEHVRMRPEWHRAIDAWVERCRARHPDVVSLDVTLCHDGGNRADDQVSIAATAHGRQLRGAGRAATMSAALEDALEAIERALTAPEPQPTPAL
jgi:ribosome-associated translation inhibitor RaiA